MCVYVNKCALFFIPSAVKCKRHMNGARRNRGAWTKELLTTAAAAAAETLRSKSTWHVS